MKESCLIASARAALHLGGDVPVLRKLLVGQGD